MPNEHELSRQAVSILRQFVESGGPDLFYQDFGSGQWALQVGNEAQVGVTDPQLIQEDLDMLVDRGLLRQERTGPDSAIYHITRASKPFISRKIPKNNSTVENQVGQEMHSVPSTDQAEPESRHFSLSFPDSELVGQLPAIRIGTHTNFKRAASGDEIVLGVKKDASVLAKLFRSADEKDMCFGIFGAWGRGKSFLMEQVISALKDRNVDKESRYEVVEFKAWKYPTRPEVWINLYESFYSVATKQGWFRTLAFTILTGIQRHGVAKLWWAWTLLMVTAMPKSWAIHGIFQYFGKLTPLLGVAIVFFVVVFVYEFWTTTSNLRRHYLSGARHFMSFGLQATIGDDLKALLQGWVQVDLKSKGIKTGLRFMWGAALGLIGFIFWRSYEAGLIALLLSAGVLVIPILISAAFNYSAHSPSRILLVVDDLDRCQFDHLLAIMESIKLLLEDPVISRRVQVAMLV